MRGHVASANTIADIQVPAVGGRGSDYKFGRIARPELFKPRSDVDIYYVCEFDTDQKKKLIGNRIRINVPDSGFATDSSDPYVTFLVSRNYLVVAYRNSMGFFKTFANGQTPYFHGYEIAVGQDFPAGFVIGTNTMQNQNDDPETPGNQAIENTPFVSIGPSLVGFKYNVLKIDMTAHSYGTNVSSGQRNFTDMRPSVYSTIEVHAK